MAYYPPQTYPGYPPAPYGPPAYPPAPSPYDASYYHHHPGYPPPVQADYSSGYHSGAPPAKRQKNNAGTPHYPPVAYPPGPPPPHAGYYPPTYPPYPPVIGAPSPPVAPPGWVPPPPPGWTGPAPPPVPSPYGAQYPAPYPPPVYPPTEHHRKNSKEQSGFPRSKQWHNPNGPYGRGGRATSAAASATSQSSPHNDHTPREGSTAATPPTETPSSVTRARSRGSFGHARHSSDELHVTDEHYWYNADEEINPALSLGEIVWRPGVAIGKAMPAVWKKAGSWLKNPPAPPTPSKREQSRSRYATSKENEEEECRSVREGEDWPKMKDDPIFADLTETGRLITQREAIAKRARSAVPVDEDGDAEEGEIAGPPQYDFTITDDYDVKFGSSPPPQHAFFGYPAAPPPPPSSLPPPPPPPLNPADVPMQGIEGQDGVTPPPPGPPIDDDLIESAIRAATSSVASKPNRASLSSSVPQLNPNTIPDLSLPPKPQQRGLKRSRSRSKSPERKHPKTSHMPIKPPEFQKDQAQEDILAKLGVTGAPKPVFTTPGPAYMPPPEGQVTTNSGRLTPIAGFPIPPPPPGPPPASPPRLQVIAENDDPWQTNADGGHTPKSTTSQHTMVGSDFQPMSPVREEDNEATPKANGSLKRQRDESDLSFDNSRRQQDDDTPRAQKQLRAPRIHEAFSRRW